MADNNTDKGTDSSLVCHAELKPQDDGSLHADAGLDYDSLLFVDKDGNPVDGRTCDVIYEDRHQDFQVRIVVDEDGNMVDMYTGDGDAGLWPSQDAPESPVTATAEPAMITATTEAARPANGELSPTFPASTMVTATRLRSVVTLAPF